MYNPTAGSGNCKKIIKNIIKELDKMKKTDVEIIESKSVEHFKEVV